MTSGSVSIKSFSSWALKTKKRHRSGSGGSKDHEAKKKNLAAKRNHNGEFKGYELMWCNSIHSKDLNRLNERFE